MVVRIHWFFVNETFMKKNKRTKFHFIFSNILYSAQLNMVIYNPITRFETSHNPVSQKYILRSKIVGIMEYIIIG